MKCAWELVWRDAVLTRTLNTPEDQRDSGYAQLSFTPSDEAAEKGNPASPDISRSFTIDFDEDFTITVKKPPKNHQA